LEHPRVGVLLVNLGSPAAPTAPALRAYLKQFLSDRRVVDLPRPLWWPLLHGLVLPLRAPRSAELYRRVWTEQGAPLLAISHRQAALLGQRLGSTFAVAVAMRYGEPSLAAGLRELADAGVERLVVVPMFPQYAEATVGSIRAELPAALARAGLALPTTWVEPFPEAPDYIAALAARLAERAPLHSVDHVVFSFHGLPQKQVDRGDPYRVQCEATARALAAKLELPARRWTLVFQSRFGPAAWLQPYADVAVPALAASAPRVLVACPGFTADCLETLDEIGSVLAETFRAAGGGELLLAEGLNDHPLWIATLERLVRERAAAPAGDAAHHARAGLGAHRGAGLGAVHAA
jgi:protoporphyrin/coproporphyrin ferrochelatase